MTVVQQTIQHGANGSRIAQQLAPSPTGRFEVSMVLARS